jgi:hypothetical protein
MRRSAFLVCAAGLWCLGTGAAAQDPAPTPRPAAPEQQAPSAVAAATSSSKGGKQKYSHANDFVIRGTVFTDKALAFSGAELRVRRAGDKKYKVHDFTNSRGEFAIRVPRGFDYEMLVHVKGFADQTRTIDAKNGPGENNLVFRMERGEGENK